MVGALSMVGSVVDTQLCPSVCVDSLSLSNPSFKSSGEVGRMQVRKAAPLALSSSFVDSWEDGRLSARVFSGVANRQCRRQSRLRKLVVANELGGQYEDTFEDVKMQLLNYLTYKAAKTVLNQLYEMNPPLYTWFYNFMVANKPGDGKRFIRILVKERQDLGERVMITRLHLYNKWVKVIVESFGIAYFLTVFIGFLPFVFVMVKKCDHAKFYQEISDQNLELMRERLIQTVIWPTDDTSTEKIG